jgi:putative ABC transport system permease protein
MNAQIIIAGLRARPVRTAVGVLAVTLEVVLILLLVGVTNGAVEETGGRVKGVGAEILLKDKGASYIMAFNSAVLPIKELGGAVASVQGVKAVAPVVTDTDSGGLTVVYGIDPESFNAATGGFNFYDGKMFSAPDEAVIDDWQAGKEHLKVGDTMKVLKRNFKVTGIVANGKGARIFVPITTLQEKLSRKDFATIFYIKLFDKSDTDAAIERIRKLLEGEKYEVVDVDRFVSLMFESNASLINGVFKVVVFLGVAIGVLVIFLSMYTSVTERTREIGILRSMGASKGFIVALVLQESLVLCIIGAVVGVGGSFALAVFLKKLMPTLVIAISQRWVLQASAFALLSGVIGSLYPAYKAASQDPIEALAYE